MGSGACGSVAPGLRSGARGPAPPPSSPTPAIRRPRPAARRPRSNAPACTPTPAVQRPSLHPDARGSTPQPAPRRLRSNAPACIPTPAVQRPSLHPTPAVRRPRVYSPALAVRRPRPVVRRRGRTDLRCSAPSLQTIAPAGPTCGSLESRERDTERVPAECERSRVQAGGAGQGREPEAAAAAAGAGAGAELGHLRLRYLNLPPGRHGRWLGGAGGGPAGGRQPAPLLPRPADRRPGRTDLRFVAGTACGRLRTCGRST